MYHRFREARDGKEDDTLKKIRKKNEPQKEGKGKSPIVITMIAVIVVLVIVLAAVLIDAFVLRKSYSSPRYGYSIRYDGDNYEIREQKLDEKPTYMEFCMAKGDEYANFFAVSPVSSEEEVDKALEAFQSDGSYSFSESEARFGKGDYRARKISYTDTSGEVSLTVDYYYAVDRQVLITVSYDAAHKKDFEKILKSFKFTKQ